MLCSIIRSASAVASLRSTAAVSTIAVRSFASAKPKTLKERLVEIIPEKQAEVKEVRKAYGSKVLGETTVEHGKSYNRS
ncbi:hypothetical protein BASA60_001642 [Batrachochytrium salamandrivorans]|nr:hypothetical protein BASA60_001642 [Batrachochytrium salamandrivorans]